VRNELGGEEERCEVRARASTQRRERRGERNRNEVEERFLRKETIHIIRRHVALWVRTNVACRYDRAGMGCRLLSCEPPIRPVTSSPIFQGLLLTAPRVGQPPHNTFEAQLLSGNPHRVSYLKLKLQAAVPCQYTFYRARTIS